MSLPPLIPSVQRMRRCALRGDAVAAKIKAFAGEPVRAGPGSELSHVCACGDLDGEFGIEGLGETVKHPKTRYGAASFKPSYG